MQGPKTGCQPGAHCDPRRTAARDLRPSCPPTPQPWPLNRWALLHAIPSGRRIRDGGRGQRCHAARRRRLENGHAGRRRRHEDLGLLQRAECLRRLLLAGVNVHAKIDQPDRTAGSASASTAAALSLPMTSFGVPLGAKARSRPSRQRRDVGRQRPCECRLSPPRTSLSPSGGPKKRSARPPNPENAGEVLEAEPQLTLTKLRARAMMIDSKVWDEYAVALRIAGIPD